MKGRIKGQNLYKTKLSTIVSPISVTGDPLTEFDIIVDSAPANSQGRIFIDFEETTTPKRDLIFYHSLSGNTLKYYRKNRDLLGNGAATIQHDVGANVQINDVTNRVNRVSSSTEDFGYVEDMGTNKVMVYGGNVLYNGAGATIADSASTALTVGTRDAIFDYPTGTFTFVSTGTAYVGLILATIVSTGTDITSITDKRQFQGMPSFSTDYFSYSAGVMTLKKQMSIDADTSGFKLVGDQSTRGNLKYYGTNAVGAKGIFDCIPGPQGDQGYQGTQGDQGDQGYQGDQGDQGYQGGFGGPQGDQGYQGTQGNQGDQGYQGDQGDQGHQGTQGNQGDQGDQGYQGYKGNQGTQGYKGDQGDQGYQGTQGYTGDQGDVYTFMGTRTIGTTYIPGTGAIGVEYDGSLYMTYTTTTGEEPDTHPLVRLLMVSKGSQGDQGYTGNQGTQGDQGDQGYQGYKGVQGDQGYTGNQGTQGYQGDQGDVGDQGYRGYQGDQGYQGYQGDKGDQGDQGYQGGFGGPQGAQGYTGNQGNQGDQGYTGNQGDQGYTGNQGNQGDQGVEGNNTVIQLKIIDDTTSLYAGDGQIIFCIPSEYNNFNLIGAQAFVSTVSSSGLPTIQIRNVTDAQDMLSTRITIDASAYTSYTATTPSVVDAAHDDVVTGDLIAIDVDVAGTGTKGLGIILVFQPQ